MANAGGDKSVVSFVSVHEVGHSLYAMIKDDGSIEDSIGIDQDYHWEHSEGEKCAAIGEVDSEFLNSVGIFCPRHSKKLREHIFREWPEDGVGK